MLIFLLFPNSEKDEKSDKRLTRTDEVDVDNAALPSDNRFTHI